MKVRDLKYLSIIFFILIICYVAAICSDPMSLPNSNIRFSPNDVVRFLRGTIAIYTCIHGYQISGESNRTCEDSGSGGVWSKSNLTCTGNAVWLYSLN